MHNKVKFEALKKSLPSVCKVALNMIPAALFAICSWTGAGPAVMSNLWFLCLVGFSAAVGTDNAGNCQLQMYVSWVKIWKKDFLWKQDCLFFLVLVSGNSWLHDPFKIVDNWIGKSAKSLWKQCLSRHPFKCTVTNHKYKQSRLTELLGVPTYSLDPAWPPRINHKTQSNFLPPLQELL